MIGVCFTVGIVIWYLKKKEKKEKKEKKQKEEAKLQRCNNDRPSALGSPIRAW